MSFDFDALNKRLQGVSVDKLAAISEEKSAPRDNDDDNMWKLQLDDAGNGSAIIRMLPPMDGEAPWAEFIDHFFQGPGGWYVERSRNSLPKRPNGQWEPDPVGDWLRTQYDAGDAAVARLKKMQADRRYHNITNIYVVSDPANPENEGKVFKWRFPKTVREIIEDAYSPSFPGDTPINPFHPLAEGANFELRIYSKYDPKAKKNFPQYDRCRFSAPAPLLDDIDQIVEICSQVYSLADYTDPAQYKSYDELQARLNVVLGLNAGHEEAEAPALEEKESSFVVKSTEARTDEDQTGGEAVSAEPSIEELFRNAVNKS